MAVRNISVIPARSRFETVNEVVKKLRVCAYCRVSTDSEEQLTSYEAQVNHYTDYIKKNSEWEFAGIYADVGVTYGQIAKMLTNADDYDIWGIFNLRMLQ